MFLVMYQVLLELVSLAGFAAIVRVNSKNVIQGWKNALATKIQYQDTTPTYYSYCI